MVTQPENPEAASSGFSSHKRAMSDDWCDQLVPVRLRKCRTAAGLTMADLAAALPLSVKISAHDIRRLEGGYATPALDEVKALAAVLGTSWRFLLHGTGNETAIELASLEPKERREQWAALLEGYRQNDVTLEWLASHTKLSPGALLEFLRGTGEVAEPQT